MINHGIAFIKYIEKHKDKYFEGFKEDQDTPSYNSSKQVFDDSQVRPDTQLIQSQDTTLLKYSNAHNANADKTQDYLNRISPSNPYLNKFIAFTDGTIAYVTNLGVAKQITSESIYSSLLGKNGCPTTSVTMPVPLTWSNSYIEGSIIPTTPSLVVGTKMNAGESCGNEGENVFVSSLISKDATSTYQGCFQDSSPSTMTFIGDRPPIKVNAVIVNGDFSQPALANNTYRNFSDNSSVPGWEFNAVILNNSDDWGFIRPYPFGSQCVSIQNYNGNKQHIIQTINFTPGTYKLTFSAVGRKCCDSSGVSNLINIILDGRTTSPLTFFSFQPPLNKWTSYSTSFTIYVAGTHSITFQGSGSPGDKSTAIQGIKISSTGEPASTGGNYTYNQCKTAAIDGGYQYFGLQNGNLSSGKGYCAVTNDSVGATRNGTSYAVSGGIKLWSSETSGIGNTATISLQGSLSVINSESMFIFNIPNNNKVYENPASNGGTPDDYIGCYGDTGNRAIENTSNNQYLTLNECKNLAIDKRFTYYGWQYNRLSLNGWCVGSNDMNKINKYGPATNCTKLSDGTMGGGAWSNAMYKTDLPPSDYYLILQDDGNLCLYKGTGPNDHQGDVWCAMTNGKQQKPNPQFKASNGKFGKNYIKTGDTLAAGDFVGSTDGSIYLLMQSDGNLVLYTSQNKENCSNIVGLSNVGGEGATALYKMSEVGNPANLGKIAYVDKNSEIYNYPDNKIGLSNNYIKYDDSDSMGYDIPGTAYSGGSLDDCKKTCNNLNDCHGAVYNSAIQVCYPKNKEMYPVGSKQTLIGYDLYVREKNIKEGFTFSEPIQPDTIEIDTNKWKNYINNNKIFDDSILDSATKQLSSADKQKLSDLNNKITNLSKKINKNNVKYKQHITNVNNTNVKNTVDLNNFYSEYDKIQLKIKDSGENLNNMNNIMTDSNILVVQQNSHYITWSIIAIILLLIAIKILS